ncbi:MAG: molybdate ABC transporter permease subunit [Deltaproteobacteria bacterium]|nr:molybdate ABC transporter permease subunit [Deltaproteobacteria bacterium]MBT6436145.1 molybdate ABC transporter permease subunit [Deltaproteobacteria bacterium]MBT6490169.1 molybdate ABC transporter permease subunit [Deltaproteobacteria bacterium]
MRQGSEHTTSGRWRSLLLAMPMLVLLVLPIFALVFSSSPAEFMAGTQHPLFFPALTLSLQSTFVSLILIILAGTPLAWWLAHSSGRSTRVIATLVELPIVLPPAVIGVALLQVFGRSGFFGETLAALGWQIPFTTLAVILAQTVIAAPFYVQSATAAFKRVDSDLLLVARTLGQTRMGTLLRVAVPLALPGLLSGAALAWARALGEFGATLLFAGNLSGETQTMPLAIYTALESDVRAALALALVLAAGATILLMSLRLLPIRWLRDSKYGLEGNS